MFDHAQSFRLGQRTGVEQPGIWIAADVTDLPEAPAHGQVVFRRDVNTTQVYDDTSATWLNVAGASTSSTSTRTASASDTFGGPTKAWDDFHRTNRLLRLDHTPSGHQYTIGGITGNIAIVGNRFVPTVNPAEANIAYLTHASTLNGMAMEWVWTGAGTATTGNENVVIGSCGIGFGQGSVQLAIYAVNKPGSVSTKYSLFYVPNPIVDPYPVISEGNLNLTFDRSGATTYRMGMWRTGTNEITILLPDGQIISGLTNVGIGTYWGVRSGYQLRRPNTTDGHAEITSIATWGDATPGGSSVPPLTSLLHLTGGSTTGVSAPDPSTPLNADIDVSFAMIPDSLTPAAAQTFGSQYSGAVGDRSWRVMLTTTSLLQLSVSYDGSALTTVSSSVALSSTATAVRVTRQSSTGDVKFYTSIDPAGTNEASVTWTQLGVTRSTTAGDLFNSGNPIQVGLSATSSFTGTAYWAVFKSGIAGTIVASVDFRHLWPSGTTYTGPVGNVWALAGTAYEWFLTTAAIDGLPAELTGLHTQLDAVAAPLWVRKTSDESVTSSTVLQNDDQLKLTLAASSVYEFTAYIGYEGPTTGDIKIAFSYPTGGTISWAPVGGIAALSSDTATTVVIRPRVDNTSDTFGAFGVGTPCVVRLSGIVLTSTTAGDLQMQWAQGTSDVTATIVKTNSFLRAEKRT